MDELIYIWPETVTTWFGENPIVTVVGVLLQYVVDKTLGLQTELARQLQMQELNLVADNNQMIRSLQTNVIQGFQNVTDLLKVLPIYAI